MADQHFNKCKIMVTLLEDYLKAEETKDHVENFIKKHDLFSADYEVAVVTCKYQQSVSIVCQDYGPQLSRICELVKKEFDSELHVASVPDDSSKLEFWFIISNYFNEDKNEF